MNTKEQIFQEIELFPEALLAEVLEFVQALRVKHSSQLEFRLKGEKKGSVV